MPAIRYRPATAGDAPALARLAIAASGGLLEYLLEDIAPGQAPVELLRDLFADPDGELSFRDVDVAECEGRAIGMAHGFPASRYGISEPMRAQIPANRLRRVEAFFSRRVDRSLFLNILSVDEAFRGQGIGQHFLEVLKARAAAEGYESASLLVWADNVGAARLYRRCGFEMVETVPVDADTKLPHPDGALLMRCWV